MPQDMNIPEGKLPIGESRGVEAPGSGQIVSEQSPEHAIEASKERAGEKYTEILSKIPTTASPAVPSDGATIGLDAQSVYDETDEEARVTKLLSLVETKGVEYAVKVARHLNDYYVLDRMHDELSGRFYEALVAKGVIHDE